MLAGWAGIRNRAKLSGNYLPGEVAGASGVGASFYASSARSGYRNHPALLQRNGRVSARKGAEKGAFCGPYVLTFAAGSYSDHQTPGAAIGGAQQVEAGSQR